MARKPPYLITSLNEMPGKDRWVESADRILGDSVQPLVIMWEPEFPVPSHWIVKKMGRPYAGHLAKLLPLLDPDLDLDLDRWFVFTDGSDVLFQTPLPELDGAGYEVLLSDEGEAHRDSDFWTPHLALPWFASLATAPIYNVGSWAARGRDFLEFVASLRETAQALRDRGCPLVDVHEQLIYNLWVQRNRERCGVLDRLFCTLYANFTGPRFNGRGAARLEGGQFVDAQGAPYAVVHGNGSTKGLLDRAGWASPESAAACAAGLRTGE